MNTDQNPTNLAFVPDMAMFPAGSAGTAELLQANPHQLAPIPLELTGLGPVAPRSMTVCSVHFKTKTLRFFHSNRRIFVLPAAAKGKYTLLKFYDSQQAIMNVDRDNGNREPLPMPVSVESIAEDFRSNWCAGYVGPMGKFPPGIGIIAGDYPTAAELADLNAKQERMCRALVEEADGIEKGTIQKVLIGDDHRSALEWMGSEKRSWYRPIEAGHTKVSVITGNRIPMEALADVGSDIPEYYIKYELDPLMYGDTHVAKMFEDKPDMKLRIQRRLGMVTPSIPNGKEAK